MGLTSTQSKNQSPDFRFCFDVCLFICLLVCFFCLSACYLSRLPSLLCQYLRRLVPLTRALPAVAAFWRSFFPHTENVELTENAAFENFVAPRISVKLEFKKGLVQGAQMAEDREPQLCSVYIINCF